MGQRTSYQPGTFSWSELVTSDAGAAKRFYTSLFGWEYDDMPIANGPPYSMAKRDGQTVAALYPSEQQPPHWNCYVTVESADDAAAKAKELGANLITEPFDVLDAGRMAVFADPTGAVLAVWQAGTSIGGTLVNQPGALTWNDLLTPDIDKAASFYGDLFGWETEEIPTAHGYRVIRNRGRANGGMMPTTDAPPAFMPYFGHEDVETLLSEVEGLGGRVHVGPVKMPQGTIAVLDDPQGATFAVWTGEYEG
jgi:predicted enzyme related to lactoylglutathione lyase